MNVYSTHAFLYSFALLVMQQANWLKHFLYLFKLIIYQLFFLNRSKIPKTRLYTNASHGTMDKAPHLPPKSMKSKPDFSRSTNLPPSPSPASRSTLPLGFLPRLLSFAPSTRLWKTLTTTKLKVRQDRKCVKCV